MFNTESNGESSPVQASGEHQHLWKLDQIYQMEGIEVRVGILVRFVCSDCKQDKFVVATPINIVIPTEKKPDTTAFKKTFGRKIEKKTTTVPTVSKSANDAAKSRSPKSGAGCRKKILARKYDTSIPDIRAIKFFFSLWENQNKFTANQLEAVKDLKGVFADKLTEGQRIQILNIFNDVRSTILGSETVKNLQR